MAATYRQSFLRRAEKGKGGAYAHFFSRYLAIIGLGTIFSAGGAVVEHGAAWGVLQAIGMAGLITLLVIQLPTAIRAVIAFAVLGAYQFLSYKFVGDLIFTGEHGGFIGAVAWGALLILSTVMIDFYSKGLKPFLISTGVLSLLSVGSIFIVDISKNRISLSYVLVSVSLSCILYLLVNLLSKVLKKPWIVSYWGENPTLFYILHLLVMGITKIPFELMHRPRTLWLALPINFIILAAMSLLAWQMHRKNKQFVL